MVRRQKPKPNPFSAKSQPQPEVDLRDYDDDVYDDGYWEDEADLDPRRNRDDEHKVKSDRSHVVL